MKNLFLSLAFMLVASFAYANTSDSSIDLNKIESLINVDTASSAEDFSRCGFTVNFDDGTGGNPFGPWGGSGSFWYENDTCTWDDIFSMIDALFPGWDAIVIN